MRLSSVYRQLYLAGGFASVALACAALAFDLKIGSLLFCGGAGLWLGFWFQSNPIIQACKDRLVVRPGPLRSMQIIMLSEVVAVVGGDSSLRLRNGESVGLPVSILGGDDTRWLENFLREKLAPKKR